MELKENENLSKLLPEMPPEEFESLKEDISENGLDQPIIVDEEKVVIDGHNRLRACKDLGIEITEDMIKVVPGLTQKEKQERAISLNLKRRHLSREQRNELVKEFKEQNPESSNREIAKIFGIDDHTVKKALEECASAENPQLTKTTGADGKKRPASKEEIEKQQQEIQKEIKDHPKKNDSEIADKLHVSPNTVKKQRQALEAESNQDDDPDFSGQEESEGTETPNDPYSLKSIEEILQILIDKADSTKDWLYYLIYDCEGDPGKEEMLSSAEGSEKIIEGLADLKEAMDEAIEEAIAHLRGENQTLSQDKQKGDE